MSKLIFYFWKKYNKLFFVYLIIVCALSPLSTWSQSGITIAGDPAGSSGSDFSHLNGPAELYYDETNNKITVADISNSRDIQFSLNNPPSAGTVIAGGNGGGCTLDQVYTAIGVAFDSYGQLYSSEPSCTGRILKFPPGSTSSTNGTLIDYINNAEQIFVNPLTDDLYVASLGDAAVYKFPRNSTVPVVVAGTSCSSEAAFSFTSILLSYIFI
jgi:hypothetical protein